MKARATKRETKLYREWQMSQQRVQMALSTLTGAQQACVTSEVAFKAAATLKHGPKATFEFDEEKGLRFVLPSQVPRRELPKKKR